MLVQQLNSTKMFDMKIIIIIIIIIIML